jgi:hypothetical protein
LASHDAACRRDDKDDLGEWLVGAGRGMHYGALGGQAAGRADHLAHGFGGIAQRV